MTKWLKRLAAITLSVMMALTLFPLIGGVSFTQTAFADDEIVQDDGDVGGGVSKKELNEEEPAEEVQDENAPTKDSDDPEDPDEPEDPEEPDEPEDVGYICIDPQNWDYGFELYSDGNRKFYVYDEDDSGLKLLVRVGAGFVGAEDVNTVAEWEAQFAKLFVKGSTKDYTFSSGVLTLRGSAIYKKVKGTYNDITISAALVDGEGTIKNVSESDVSVRAVQTNYWMLDDLVGTKLFPKEYAYVDKYFEGYIENSAHPDGYPFDCTVTKVKTSKKSVAKVIKKKNYWSIKGVKKGTATITVYFKGYKKAAKTKKITVKVVGERVVIPGIFTEDDDYYGLPGESLELEAGAYYENSDYDSDDEHFDYNWKVVDEDAEYGELEVNSEDPSKATLTFKEGAGLADKDYHSVGIEVTATYNKENGSQLSERVGTDQPTVLFEYEKFVSDPKIPKNIDIGGSFEFTPKLKKCVYDPDTQTPSYDYVDVGEWDIDTDDSEVMSVTENGNGTYTITRQEEGEVELNIKANWDYDAEEDNWSRDFPDSIYFDEIGLYLDEYYIDFVGSDENCYYVGQEGIIPEVRLVDRNTGYVLPEEEYTLTYSKINQDEDENWDDEYGDDDDWDDTDEAEPWGTPLTYDYDPSNPWTEDNGFAEYVVFAYATEDNEHGFEDGTEEEVYIYSDHVLAADITIDDKYKQYEIQNALFENGVIYHLPFMTEVAAEDFTVELWKDSTILTPNADFEVRYIDMFAEDWNLSEEFPTVAGIYNIYLVGVGDYFGAEYVDTIFVGEKNTAVIKASTKTVKARDLKKKGKTLTSISVTESVGGVNYEKISGSSKLTVNEETGKVTVKKGTKKGTYTAYVVVFVEGDNYTAPAVELVKVTVKVK